MKEIKFSELKKKMFKVLEKKSGIKGTIRTKKMTLG